MTHDLDVPALVADYRRGHSVAAIARTLGVDSSAVRRRLDVAGEPIRDSRGATALNLARDPSLRARMGRPRMYPVNSTFFDEHTPDMAYVVGLLQADGSNQHGRAIVCITLKASDASLLTAVSERMAGGRPLRSDGYGNPKLLVSNRALSDGLARRGVVSPKTHTASTHPDLLLDRDYWRGVVDGDGTLCDTADGRRILALVGTEAICSQFLAFCRYHGAAARCNVHRNRSIFTTRVSGPEALRMARVLYSGAGLALNRKRAVAARWKVTA